MGVMSSRQLSEVDTRLVYGEHKAINELLIRALQANITLRMNPSLVFILHPLDVITITSFLFLAWLSCQGFVDLYDFKTCGVRNTYVTLGLCLFLCFDTTHGGFFIFFSLPFSKCENHVI